MNNRYIIQISIKDGLESEMPKEVESSQADNWEEAERLFKAMRKRLEKEELKTNTQE